MIKLNNLNAIIKNIWGFLLKYRNQIYVLLFINYTLFFLIKVTKISFLGFTSNKKISLITYLFWGIPSFLVKKSLLGKTLVFTAILAFLILDFMICIYIWKLINAFINNTGLKNVMNIAKSDYFILSFLLIFSAIIRFGFLNAGLYHHDSFQLAIAAESTVNDLRLHEIGGGRQGSVLVNSLFFYLFKTLFGHDSAEFTVNFTSAMFGALSIPVLYLLVKNLTNDKFTSFSSSILYSVSPVFLSVSTFAKEHTMDSFIALSSMLLLVAGLKRRNYPLVALSGLLLSSLTFVRLPSILIIFSMAFLVWDIGKADKDSRLDKLKAAMFFLVPFIASIALYIILSFGTFANEARSNFNLLSASNIKFVLLNNISYAISGIIFSLTIAGVLLSVIGLAVLFKEKRSILYFLLLFFTPIFVFYAASKTVSHRFFYLPMIPLLVALSYTLSHIKKKDAFAAIIILALLAAASFLNIYPIIKLRHEFSAFKDMAAMVSNNTNPEDSIVILYGDDTIALDYYSETPAMGCYYEPDIVAINNFIDKAKSLIGKGLKVYISGACFGLGTYDEQAAFLKHMGKNFKGSIVAEYISDDYHRGSIKPTIKKVSMLRLYDKNSQKGSELRNLQIEY